MAYQYNFRIIFLIRAGVIIGNGPLPYGNFTQVFLIYLKVQVNVCRIDKFKDDIGWGYILTDIDIDFADITIDRRVDVDRS
ncbi:hypothetical protein D3C85_1496830 [compost metagenome]